MPAHTTTTTAPSELTGPQPLALTVPGQRLTRPQTTTQRHRAHLDRLLEVRSQLARLVAERRSHRLDDEADVFAQQLAVEAAIRDHDRTAYEERWPHWVEADVLQEHEPTTLVSWCQLCQAVAASSGINLLRPEPDTNANLAVAHCWDFSAAVAA